MEVQLCETVSVDIETMVHVSVDDILSEFSRQLLSCDMNDELPPYKRLSLPLLDFATKLMATIPDAAIAGYTDAQRAEVIRRLRDEFKRWNLIHVDTPADGEDR
jgi:hypothetical protein